METRPHLRTHRAAELLAVADLLAVAAYIVLSLALCWPLPLHLGSDVAGRYVDARVFQWNNWWVKKALLEGRDLDYTDYMYAPSGVSLVSHNFNWASSFLSVPLDLAFGPLVAYNLLYLLTFWLSGFAMYGLALHLTGRRDAAFLAGLVFAFFPYHLSGNWDGQMNLANVQWLPLTILFLLRAVERNPPGRRADPPTSWRAVGDALLAGLFLALAGLDCWFFLLFLGMWGAVWLIHSAIARRQAWNWRAAGLVLLVGAVGTVLMAPFLVPVIAESTSQSVEAAVAYHAEDKASDLLAFFVPGSDHPWLGKWVRPIYERFWHWRPASLGSVALLLALYAVVARPRRSLLWLLSGLLFAGLALGTTLTVNGVSYPGVPTPYRLLTGFWPALKIVRQANRFNVMVGLALAALVGIGWADLAGRLGRRARSGSGRAILATAAAGLLILFEYLAVPCPLQPGAVSPFYHTLAVEGAALASAGASPAQEPGLLLELPIDDFHSRYSLYPQTVHGLKLINGYVARMPPGTLAYIRSQPLLKFLHLQMEVDPALLDVEREIGLLAANGLRYVVLHKQALPPQPPVDAGVLAGWRALWGPEVHYEDDEIAVYRVPTAVEAAPVLRLGEELGLDGVRARRTWTLPPGDHDEQYLTVDLTWTALADLQAEGRPDYACRLSLLDGEGTLVAEGDGERISPRYPTSRWPEGVVVADLYALPIDAALPAGAYRLRIAVLDGETERAAAEHAIQLGSEAQPLVPALAGMSHPAGVTYGDEMRLLGYDLAREGGRLQVALYWQAMTAIHDQYKIFVHLLREAVGPSDGAIVGQHDGMPRDWSYPTSLWGRREVYIERITLDLPEGEDAAYRLAVGVYSDEAGRLAAVGVDGQRLPDDQAILAGLK
jgi:hypothetical protein